MLFMSKRTDAEKAAYWKEKALANMNNKGYKPKKAKGDAYYNYKSQKDYYKRKAKNQERAPGVMSDMGGEVGALLGAPLPIIGPVLGKFLGSKIGHLAEKITGFGDYKVQSNSIMQGGMSNAQIVNSSDNGGTIVRHREYLGDIAATTDFTVTKYPLNPGQVITFPWLSNIAQNYEQYRFRGVIFEVNSTSSDAVLSSATSSALGTVALATDYDVLDAPYASKREMLNSQFSCSRKPSESFIHPIECKKAWTPYNLNWVRTTDTFPTGGDPRTYDLGNLYVATEGMQAASGNVGELWVTYEVEFFKQQLLPLGAEVAADHLYVAAPTSSLLLGAASTFDTASTLGGTHDGGTYYFPTSLTEGLFLVQYSVFGTSATLGEVSYLMSNCEKIDVWFGGATTFIQSPGAGVASTSVMASIVVRITAANAAISYLTTVIPTSGNGNLWITELPQAMANPA